MENADKVQEYIDFEIALRPKVGFYSADVRLDLRDQGEIVEIAHDIRVVFDFNQLLEATNNKDEYGALLARMLFSSNIYEAWKEASIHAQYTRRPLRCRLRITDTPDQLHGIYWELIRDPLSNPPHYLTLAERVLFSRVINTRKVEQFDPLLFNELRALIAVGNPKNISFFNLGSIDYYSHIKPCETAFNGIATTVLARTLDINGMPVTFQRILEELHKHPNIICLFCHCQYRDGQNVLFLEDDSGCYELIPGKLLVEKIAGSLKKPSLVILAACSSAGVGYEDSAGAIGSQLAASGVGAVIAMQGTVSFKIASIFIPHLLKDLRIHGQIERAVAYAREHLRPVGSENDDWWRPALFTRLRDGLIWKVPGKTSETNKLGIDTTGILSNADLGETPTTEEESTESLVEICSNPAVDLAKRLLAAKRLGERGDPREGVCQLNVELAWSTRFPAARYPAPLHQKERDKYSKPWLNAYKISRYQITVYQFIDFIKNRPYNKRSLWTLYGWLWNRDQSYKAPLLWDEQRRFPNQPVVGVSWYEATAFCRWLTRRGQAEKWLAKTQIIRLPTETEWEVAATWDRIASVKYKWEVPQGENWSSHFGVWKLIDSRAQPPSLPPPVGCFPLGKSPCGAEDMSGGVWEWCSPATSTSLDAADLSDGQRDFVYNPDDWDLIDDKYCQQWRDMLVGHDEVDAPARGGSYTDPDTNVSWYERRELPPAARELNVGFRVVLTENHSGESS